MFICQKLNTMKKYNASFSHDWHSGGYQECYDYELEDSDEEEVLEQLYEEWFVNEKTSLVDIKIEGIYFEVNVLDYLPKLINMLWNDEDALDLIETEEGYRQWLAGEIRRMHESR